VNTCTEGESPVQKHLALEESLIQVVEYKAHMVVEYKTHMLEA
jgi:hypothetical protein